MFILKSVFRIILLAIFFWICGYAAFLIHIMNMKPIVSAEAKDAIIVPTGGRTHRISAGLNLLASQKSEKMFITGVHKLVTQNEIRAMYEGDIRLPECCITLGSKATTTIENAAETKEWIDANNIRTIYLVTSAYHMPRTYLEFSNLMPEITITPYPVKQGMYRIEDPRFWNLTFDEYHKFLYRTVILKWQKLSASE